MNRLTLIILSTLLFAQVAFAQKLKVSWGQSAKAEAEMEKIIRGENLDIISLSTSYTRTRIISRYDNTLNLQATYAIKDMTKFTDWIDILNLGGSICLFTGKEDKKADQFNYYIQKLNGKTLVPEGMELLLGSMKTKKLHAAPIVDLVYSEDSSKLLFLCAAADYKDENELYTMAVLDSDMKMLWQGIAELPYDSHHVEKITSYVTNTGEVGIPVNVYDKKITEYDLHFEGASIPNYRTKLLLFSKAKKEMTEIAIDVDGKFLHTLQLAKDGNTKTLFGLYKNSSDGRIAGYFTVPLAEGATVLKVAQLHDFPAELLALIANDDQGSDKKSDPGLSMFYYLRDILVRNNGTTDYILQWTRSLLYLGTPDFRGIGGRQFTTNANTGASLFGDVIDIAISTSGQTAITRIPRLTQTSFNWYGDVLLTTYQNKLVLFYNEDNETLSQPIEKKPSMLHNISKSAFTMTTVDETGKINRSVVYQSNEIDVSTGVKLSKRFTSNRFGIFATNGSLNRRYQMGMLEIN